MVRGVSAGATSTMLAIAGNVLLLPLYLRHWSVTRYGEWMTVYSVVNYLGALDFGLTTAATNVAAHAFAAQDWPVFRRTQGTAWALSIAVAILGSVASVVILTFFKIESWLGITVMSPSETRVVFAGLAMTLLIGIPSRQISSTYIALGEFTTYQWLYNAGQIATILAIGIALVMGMAPEGISVLMASLALISLGVTYGVIRRRDSKLLPSLRFASWKTARKLAWPSGQFLLQMFSNMIAVQGPVIIVSRAFGGQAVALFTTTRTVCNVVRSILTVFRAPLRPEYAVAYAQPTRDRLRFLFRVIMAIDTTIAATLMAAIWTGGAWAIRIWSHHHLNPDSVLLHLLLSFSLIEGFLWMLASAGNAANRFHGVSVGVMVYALASILISGCLVRRWGMSVIPLSSILCLVAFMLPVTILNAHYEIDLPIIVIVKRLCVPFALIVCFSILVSVGLTFLAGSTGCVVTCLSTFVVLAGSIIAASWTMLDAADRQQLWNRVGG